MATFETCVEKEDKPTIQRIDQNMSLTMFLAFLLSFPLCVYSASLWKRECQYNGTIYQPGESISDEKSEKDNLCHGVYCDEMGILVFYNIWNCMKTPATTTKILTTTKRIGCLDNGKWYEPGDDISSGRQGAWCYGSYCNEEGEIIHWDDWECIKTTRPTPSTTTTATTTTKSRSTTTGKISA